MPCISAGLSGDDSSYAATRGACTILEHLNLSAVFLDWDGFVVNRTEKLFTLYGGLASCLAGKLQFSSPSANELLKTAMNSRQKGPWWFGLSATSASPAAVVNLSPIRQAEGSVWPRAAFVVIIFPIALPSTSPSPEILQGLYRLSKAEARVASAILEGRSLNDLAGPPGPSIETLRTQIKSAMTKIGVRRQRDLVAMFSAVSFAIDTGIGDSAV